MLRKAGFIERGRRAAIDEDGRPCRIVEVTLDGRRFGARFNELRQALDTRRPARVEPLGDNRGPVLGGVVGRAERSRSGAAIIFEFFTGERYTVPTAALRAVLARAASYAPVAAILPDGRPASRQQVLITG